MNRNFTELLRAFLGILIFGSIFMSVGVYATGEPQVNTTVPGIIDSSSVIATGGSVGSVAGNETTKWGIQYGLATSTYTNWSNNTGSMVLYPQNFTSLIFSLTPGERYYFRAYVQGTGFINYGSEVSNMTLCDPLATLSSTPISATSLFVSFTYTSVGTGSTPYAYIRYKEGSYPVNTTDGTLLCNTTLSEWTLTGLTFGHTYFFTGWQTAIHSGAFSGYSTAVYAAATPSYTGGVVSTSPALWESYCSAPNSTAMTATWGPYWQYQIFTTGSIAHTISRIKLNLSRTGAAPGTAVVSIKRVESGVPIGADLVAGAIDGNLVSTNNITAWYESTMSSEIALLANTQYAITLNAQSGGSLSGYLSWSASTAPGYAGGNNGVSSNNGYSWTAATEDNCFEIWGFPALEVQSARVYQTYINAGDWIVVCHYRNVYPPYYPSDDPKTNFAIQFLDGASIIAQSPCSDWGYRPGSVYINAAAAATKTWGSGYKIRLVNLNDQTVYSEFLLAPSCWVGSNMELLDSYVLSIASAMETYYAPNLYTTAVATYGKVLNTDGGVKFSVGIPYLVSARPNLFATSASLPAPQAPSTGTQALQSTIDWRVAVGPQIAASFDAAGHVFGGLNGRMIGIMMFVVMYMILAAFIALAGQSGAAIFLSFPTFIVGAVIGFIPLAVMFVALAIAAFLLVWHFWLGRA